MNSFLGWKKQKLLSLYHVCTQQNINIELHLSGLFPMCIQTSSAECSILRDLQVQWLGVLQHQQDHRLSQISQGGTMTSHHQCKGCLVKDDIHVLFYSLYLLIILACKVACKFRQSFSMLWSTLATSTMWSIFAVKYLLRRNYRESRGTYLLSGTYTDSTLFF